MTTPSTPRSKKSPRATRKQQRVLPGVAAKAARTPRTSAPALVEVERLMNQLRDANEKLIVAAVRAQDASDVAHADAVTVKTELDDVMKRLEDANGQLAAAAADAEGMAAEAAEREEEYRQLCSQLLTVQDEERRRLALELHDSTAQNLALLLMNLSLLEQGDPALGDQFRQVIAESRALADECCRDVRMRAYLLHPPLLDERGIVSAVRWFADGFTKRSGIHVVMILDEIGRLPQPIETALYRVVQESLTNVHRHTSTNRVVIELATAGDTIALEIRDQGHGLPDDRSQHSGPLVAPPLGVGIQGMRERISQLKGTFDIEFAKKGTTVRVSVPLKKATT